MSSIVLSPGATGAAAFTIEAPSTATSRVITLPDATDTLVGKATTDTLTNKSIAATQLTGTVAVARLPAGSVLQIVTTVDTTARTTTSTSFTNTGIAASITPVSASNKVLVRMSGPLGWNNINSSCYVTAARGSTNLATSSAACFLRMFLNETNSPNGVFQFAIEFLDSPSTTSATTYNLQYRTDGNVGGDNVAINVRGGDSLNMGQTTITLSEIAG